jgi:hypothetical protein
MICETCKGRLLAVVMYVDRKGNTMPIAVPCADCGGCGHAHCCDGMQAQPEDGGTQWQRNRNGLATRPSIRNTAT